MGDELTEAVVWRCCAEKTLPEISQNQQENYDTGSPYQQRNTSTGTLLRASQNPQEPPPPLTPPPSLTEHIQWLIPN